MKIIKDDYFTQQLNTVILYIAKDSKSRARYFRNSLHEGFKRWAEVTPDQFKNKKLSCSS
jgi:hypothetical protein